VRVSGRVLSAYDSGDALSFTLQDATGDIRVQAYRSAAEALRARGRVPQPGDRVTVDGTLRIRDGDASLGLAAAASLQLERPDPVPVKLAMLDAMPLGERVTVRGQLRRVRVPSAASGLLVLTLRSGDAVADVVLGGALDSAQWPPGAWLHVTGAIGEYRDRKQVIARADDVRIEQIALESQAVHTGTVFDRDWLGRWVSIDAELLDQRPFKGGVRLLLRHGAEEIDAVVFEHVLATASVSQTLGTGSSLRVTGVIEDYRGRLELIPELGVDIVTIPGP
jgi:DNA/RNA endonuclease YhcR with UshA esterase domain